MWRYMNRDEDLFEKFLEAVKKKLYSKSDLGDSIVMDDSYTMCASCILFFACCSFV